MLVDAMPPMLDACGDLLRLSRERLRLDEHGESVDRDILRVAEHHGGGLAPLEHTRQPERVGRSEFSAVEERSSGGVGVLEGDTREIQDIARLDEFEESVLLPHGTLDRDDELADQCLEGTELETGKFGRRRAALDEGVRALGAETDARHGFTDPGVVDVAGGGKRSAIGVDVQQQRGHLIGAEYFSPAPMESARLGAELVEGVGDGGCVVP